MGKSRLFLRQAKAIEIPHAITDACLRVIINEFKAEAQRLGEDGWKEHVRPGNVVWSWDITRVISQFMPDLLPRLGVTTLPLNFKLAFCGPIGKVLVSTATTASKELNVEVSFVPFALAVNLPGPFTMDIGQAIVHELSHLYQASVQGPEAYADRIRTIKPMEIGDKFLDHNYEFKAVSAELSDAYKRYLQRDPGMTVDNFLTTQPMWARIREKMGEHGRQQILKDLAHVKAGASGSTSVGSGGPRTSSLRRGPLREFDAGCGTPPTPPATGTRGDQRTGSEGPVHRPARMASDAARDHSHPTAIPVRSHSASRTGSASSGPGESAGSRMLLSQSGHLPGVPADQGVEGKRVASLFTRKAQVLFHGTYHQFEEFSTEAIGTGVGLQAYGWGIYLTESPEVGNHYRQGVAGPDETSWFLDGQEFSLYAQSGTAPARAFRDLAKSLGYSTEVAIPAFAALVRAKGDVAQAAAAAPEAAQVLQAITSKTQKDGVLYEVDIPDDGSYLLWDKPLSQQPPAVQLALDGVDPGLWRPRIKFPAIAGDFYLELAGKLSPGPTGDDDDPVAAHQEADKKASLYLLGLGIVGIKYLDPELLVQGSMRFSYVLFSSKDIRVRKRGSTKVATPAQQETSAFQEWFRGSQVVDSAGNPLKVYHGTAHDFDTFDMAKQDSNYGRFTGREGFFFTNDPREAEDVAGWSQIHKRPSNGVGVNIKPVYLQLRNPYRRKSGGQWTQLWYDSKWEDLQAKCKKGGHDGMIITGTGKATGWEMYVVFSPTQIKSAIGNSGAFDPNDARITAAVQEPAPSITESPAFQTWFQGSQAVDAQGNPQRFFHGTSKDKHFDKFKEGMRGIWFTPDPEAASSYAMDNDSQSLKYNHDTRRYDHINESPRVIPVYLKMLKPYTMTEQEIQQFTHANNYAQFQRDLGNRIRAQGFDSVIYPDGSHVVFSSTQIKSAISSGFSPTNPKITASVPLAKAASTQAKLMAAGITIASSSFRSGPDGPVWVVSLKPR